MAKKKNETHPKLEDTLLPAEPEDVLEADEMWSFVQEKWNKRYYLYCFYLLPFISSYEDEIMIRKPEEAARHAAMSTQSNPRRTGIQTKEKKE